MTKVVDVDKLRALVVELDREAADLTHVAGAPALTLATVACRLELLIDEHARDERGPYVAPEPPGTVVYEDITPGAPPPKVRGIRWESEPDDAA